MTIIDQRRDLEAARAFTSLTAEVRQPVEGRLKEVLEAHLARAAAQGGAPGAMVEAARSLCLRGGKRLRAALVAAGHRACGGAGGPAAVVMAGVAIELFHAYLLIHDDWMDGDAVRRGGPTAHVQLRAHFQSERGGDGAAVLAGDYLSALATEALLSVPFPAARVLEALAVLTEVHREVVLGQALDIGCLPGTNVDAMYDLKTGSYTVRGPLLLGAALAGASLRVREALDRYARPLGVAFQLQDDLLGTFGDLVITGKAVGNDLRQGKRTALIEELGTAPQARALLDRVLGVVDARERDVTDLIALLETSGARARVESRLRRLLSAARDALAAAPLSPEDTLPLLGAISLLADRRQ